VLAVGVASLVDDPGELARLDRLAVSAWAGGNRHSLVKVPVEMISGRRILASEGSDDRCISLSANLKPKSGA
jgi:hypothetical protein